MSENEAETETNIEFEDVGQMEAPPLSDPAKEKIISDLNSKYEKQKAEEEFKKAAGIEEPKTKSEMITEDIPKILFNFGSKFIGCEKFKTTAEENKVIATHLNNILPKMDSKIFSVIIIILIIISKTTDCLDAIKKKFAGIKGNQDLEYDERTESMKFG
jgi:hypothetical protein